MAVYTKYIYIYIWKEQVKSRDIYVCICMHVSMHVCIYIIIVLWKALSLEVEHANHVSYWQIIYETKFNKSDKQSLNYKGSHPELTFQTIGDITDILIFAQFLA